MTDIVKMRVSLDALPFSISAMESLGCASNFADEVFQLFGTLGAFGDFSLSECSALCHYMTCYGAPRHTTIMREDGGGDHMIFILTGSVDVSKVVDNTGSKLIARVGPGGVLGEMSLIDGEPRFATCITAEPTDFALLSHDSFNEILIDHPRLGNKVLLVLLKLMTKRLRHATSGMLPSAIGVNC